MAAFYTLESCENTFQTGTIMMQKHNYTVYENWFNDTKVTIHVCQEILKNKEKNTNIKYLLIFYHDIKPVRLWTGLNMCTSYLPFFPLFLFLPITHNS